MRLDLLLALKKKGLTQRQFAKLVGDHETIISQVVNGWRNLDNKRMNRYAAVLGEDSATLFHNVETGGGKNE